MRNNKFRYVWSYEKSLCAGIYNLKDIANGVAIPPKSRVGNIMKCWELVATDLFTGLKDKNGVEIYDGDLVSDHVGNGVVEYVERKASFRVSYKNGLAKWFIDYNLKGEAESIEVIGNIHGVKHEK